MSEKANTTHENAETAAACVQRISMLLKQVEDAGLHYNSADPMTADAVEHVLITDKWCCKTCGMTNLRTCPERGKPHRRQLVRVAQDVLRLIGSKTGQIVVRPPKLSASMNGRSRLRSLRRVTMNPQALLLAYYYAVLPSNEVDPLVSECAQQLVELLEQLKLNGAQPHVDEQYAIALLSSTSLMWEEYSKKFAADLSSLRGADRRAYQEVIVNGTKEAYVAATRELQKAPSNEELQAFVGLLHDRLSRLTPQEDLNEMKATILEKRRELEDSKEEKGHKMSEEEESKEHAEMSNNAASAKMPLTTATLLSDANTSGSEAEAAQPVMMGPEIPPDWYVDEHGRSRPLHPDSVRRRREKYVKFEFRAVKAYETIITVPETKGDSVKEQLVLFMNEAQLAMLAEQCNCHPPDLRSVPRFLKLVIDGLLNALPRRLRSQAEQEVRDVLDWRIVRRSVMGSPGNIAALMRYVMRKVTEYGAPAKAEETLKLAEDMSKDLEACTPDLGTAVANAFRLMLSSIRQLHEDIAQYSLLVISQQLRDNAVPYIREFIAECLPKVDQWESSLAFVRRYFEDERVKAWTNSPIAVSATALTLEERQLRGCLRYGFLDLLRSSGIQGNDRWHDYPTESFYFEKKVIFYATNAVQENSLLLLLSGSIATVLRGKGVDSRIVNDILKQLHDKFRLLLLDELTLPHLKTSVTSLVDEALAQRKTLVALTENEITQLHGTVETMTNTTGSLYVVFEKRILSFIEAILVQGQTDPPPLGLVTDSLRRLAALLQHVLVFNWEVYQPFYKEMLLLLAQEEAPVST
ncbi:hypothetical protein TraAM80_03849 [Trypanosoma rangeli]|uniref:T-complex protein 11 n=1 Tax=Trypanosoma rangeli TaxID=5698 RepID=A0A422NMF0_TRYRA|nr:uncharacterized protein TraAM80_03849 [Trypanosoma rangeli]RNF06653.1 hypothetical protein TraAM80_03849 [Trypanosoma rangeli]|eukprot:RNF06653.1 hypothetical protein TraAM80_03849 [Trypanosoma rangeli]